MPDNTSDPDDLFLECDICHSTCPLDALATINIGNDRSDRSDPVAICDDCLSDYGLCEDCDTYYPAQSLTAVQDDLEVCPHCLSHYTQCDICGGYTHDDNNTAYEVNDATVCELCYDDLDTCSVCGGAQLPNYLHEIITGPDPIDCIQLCGDCMIGVSWQCTDCGRRYDIDAYPPNGPEKICPTCRSGYKPCVLCGSVTNLTSRLTPSANETVPVCRTCAEEHFYACGVCGRYVYLASPPISGHAPVCSPGCAQRRPPTDSESRKLRTMRMSEAAIPRADAIFLIGPYSTPVQTDNIPGADGPSLGYELECICDIDSSYITLPPIYIAKSDSSIRPDTVPARPAEIVSIPMRIDYITSDEHLTHLRLFQHISLHGGYVNESCGMHVHIAKSAFSVDLHLLRFAVLLQQYPQFTAYLGGRKPNRYCKLVSFSDSIIEIIRHRPTQDRQRAVNISDSHCRGTVECRFFAATLNPIRILQNLEAVHSAWRYTRSCTLSESTPAEYVNFVRSVRIDYPSLAKYFAGHPIDLAQIRSIREACKPAPSGPQRLAFDVDGTLTLTF